MDKTVSRRYVSIIKKSGKRRYMTYTQEMQLLSYYANDIADMIMSYTQDVHYSEKQIQGSLCGLSVTFRNDYISSISCTDFELIFSRKFALAANDSSFLTSPENYPIYTKARFTRGGIADLRHWRSKLHQFRKIAI